MRTPITNEEAIRRIGDLIKRIDCAIDLVSNTEVTLGRATFTRWRNELRGIKTKLEEENQ